MIVLIKIFDQRFRPKNQCKNFDILNSKEIVNIIPTDSNEFLKTRFCETNFKNPFFKSLRKKVLKKISEKTIVQKFSKRNFGVEKNNLSCKICEITLQKMKSKKID